MTTNPPGVKTMDDAMRLLRAEQERLHRQAREIRGQALPPEDTDEPPTVIRKLPDGGGVGH